MKKLELANDKQTKNRIKIMPGTGINKSDLVNFKSFEEIHSSFTECLKTVVDLSKNNKLIN